MVESDSSAARINVLLLGEPPQLRDELVGELQRAAPEAQVRIADTIDDARRWLVDERWSPDLLILAAEYPQVWNDNELTELWNLLPNAGVLVVLDGLTASAWRHHAALPVAALVPRARFSVQLRRELAILRGERERLPWTASAEESTLDGADFVDRPDLAAIRVGFFSADPDLKGWWRDLVESFGGTVVTLDQRPNVVLWDFDPALPERQQQLRLFRKAYPACRVVGLRNTVDERTLDESLAAGAHCLLPKLCAAELILEAIAANREPAVNG